MIKYIRFDFDFDFEQYSENHRSFILLLINKCELNEVKGSIAESLVRIIIYLSIWRVVLQSIKISCIVQKMG